MPSLLDILKKGGNAIKDVFTYSEEEQASGKKPSILERIPMRVADTRDNIESFFLPSPNEVRVRDVVREVPSNAGALLKDILQGTARSFDFVGRQIQQPVGKALGIDTKLDKSTSTKIEDILFGGRAKRSDTLSEVGETELGIDKEKNPILAPLAGLGIIGLDMVPGGQGKSKGLKQLIKSLTDDTAETLAKTTDKGLIEQTVRQSAPALTEDEVVKLTDELVGAGTVDDVKSIMTGSPQDDLVKIYRGQNEAEFSLGGDRIKVNNMQGNSFTTEPEVARIFTLSGKGNTPTIIEGTIPRSQIMTSKDLDEDTLAMVRREVSQMTEDDIAEGSLPENVIDVLIPYAQRIGKEAIDMEELGLSATKEIRLVDNPKTFKRTDVGELYSEKEPTKTTIKSDIKNEHLFDEAKKYKSAEEFVKAQGTPVYHETTSHKNINIKGFKPNKDGKTFFAENANYYNGLTYSAGEKAKRLEVYYPKETKLLDIPGRNLEESGAEFEAIKKLTKSRSDKKTIEFMDKNGFYESDGKGGWRRSVDRGNKMEKLLKDNGYSGFRFKDDLNLDGTYVDVFYGDIPKIKTKSQLTDIWNKANNVARETGKRGVDSVTETGELPFEVTQKLNNVPHLSDQKSKSLPTEEVITTFAKNANAWTSGVDVQGKLNAYEIAKENWRLRRELLTEQYGDWKGYTKVYRVGPANDDIVSVFPNREVAESYAKRFGIHGVDEYAVLKDDLVPTQSGSGELFVDSESLLFMDANIEDLLK